MNMIEIDINKNWDAIVNLMDDDIREKYILKWHPVQKRHF